MIETKKTRKLSPKRWMILSRKVVPTPEGSVRVTVEAPFDGKFIRGQRRLPKLLNAVEVLRDR